MNQTTPTSQLVRKRQLAVILSVSPRTIDGWVARRMIPFIEPHPRLHLFDPAAVKSALLAQFSIPANIPEAVLRRAELQTTS
jgi:hypothetical protein